MTDRPLEPILIFVGLHLIVALLLFVDGVPAKDRRWGWALCLVWLPAAILLIVAVGIDAVAARFRR